MERLPNRLRGDGTASPRARTRSPRKGHFGSSSDFRCGLAAQVVRDRSRRPISEINELKLQVADVLLFKYLEKLAGRAELANGIAWRPVRDFPNQPLDGHDLRPAWHRVVTDIAQAAGFQVPAQNVANII